MSDYTRPLYREIASILRAMQNCVQSGNDEWHTRHGARLEEISKLLPSGSGFDSGSKINLDESRIDRLVIHTSFHHMDEYGGYDGWSEHDVIVTPSLECGFDLRVTGRDRNDIKEYIAEVFDIALQEKWNVSLDVPLFTHPVKQETTQLAKRTS